MAGVMHSARLSARLAGRHVSRTAPRRGFKTSMRNQAAQNYPMPALSPTMTEGNIASWKLKEGDSFSAGDVILEIETDKATMDVEAQDDGVLFKITKGDGEKGVKVGQRIAVLAETGDDLSSLEVPTEDSSSAPKQEAKTESSPPPPQKEETKTKEHAPESSASTSLPPSGAPEAQQSNHHKQKYPLYPSVEALLHQNGISASDASKITATGPQGRLLKGDVLAYLGKIDKSYASKSSERLNKLSHLDLSNIKIAKPAPKAETPRPQAAAEPEVPAETEIAVPISLSAVISTQKRVQDSLGIFLPLSTFIARASELANEDLPASTTKAPTAEDLFNAVLGLDALPRSSRGHFTPDITGLSTPPLATRSEATKQPDIIDLLSARPARPSVPLATRLGALGVSAGDNIFSVTAKAGDEGRATEYLERMKIALEKEPGRLVL